MSFAQLLDLRAGESRVVRHVKPPRYGEASRRPRALTLIPTQAIGALAQGSYPLSYPVYFNPTIWRFLRGWESKTMYFYNGKIQCSFRETLTQNIIERNWFYNLIVSNYNIELGRGWLIIQSFDMKWLEDRHPLNFALSLASGVTFHQQSGAVLSSYSSFRDLCNTLLASA